MMAARGDLVSKELMFYYLEEASSGWKSSVGYSGSHASAATLLQRDLVRIELLVMVANQPKVS